MTNLQYQGFTGSISWWSTGGDAEALDLEFSSWITEVNSNPSQLNRQVTYYYGPSNASSNSSTSAKGNLAEFPQSSTNDDSLWFAWWAAADAITVNLATAWEFGVLNNGYGRPDPEAAQKGSIALISDRNSSARGYLIGSSTEDNKEFFAIAYDSGPASTSQNAWIVFKASNGSWVGAAYGPTSNTALCYSMTNNSWNLNSNSKIQNASVMLPLAHGFINSSAQDYDYGEFIAQCANPDVYALNQLSSFGAFAGLGDGDYIASMGYNAFWIKYTSDAQPTPPSVTTFVVTVVNDGGSNVFAIDGVNQATVQFTPDQIYVFDQSDPSNAGHPLRIYDSPSKTTEYGDVTVTGIPGSQGAKTQIVSPASGTYYYQCQVHDNMGGMIEVA